MEALIEKWFKHGQSVNNWYEQLCRSPEIVGVPEIIAWLSDYEKIDLKQYHFNHDISKPYIREIDSSGKEHYPNHSYHSSQLYRERYGDDVFADMILHDMDFHTKRGDDIKEVWKLPYSDHLYATAWAEIFANAELFGGFESDSFKIKRKRLVKALNKK